MSGGEILKAEGVSARLGGRMALRDVDLELAPGELVALVGPNGAGKTTLLGVLAGLLRPNAGRATLGGRAVAAIPAAERARQLAYLPQENAVHWPLPVREVVALGRLPFRRAGWRKPGPEDARAVEAALRANGLERLADRRVTELSGGERRRVLLARALAGEPEALLADEPTAGLDPGCRLDVMAGLRKAADAGAAIAVATHDLGLAGRHADRVLMLLGGRAIALGPPETTLTAARLAECYGVRPAASATFDLGPLERIDDGGGR